LTFLYGDLTLKNNPNNYDLSTHEGMENSKQWLSLVLTSLSDNATWGIPRSNTVVHINKPKKLATVAHQDCPDVSIELVFEALGWTVEYADSTR
jgi:hypothetical protein